MEALKITRQNVTPLAVLDEYSVKMGYEVC